MKGLNEYYEDYEINKSFYGFANIIMKLN